MASRNRTREFEKLRDGFRSHSLAAASAASSSGMVQMKELAARGPKALRHGLRKSEDKAGLLAGAGGGSGGAGSHDIEMGPEVEEPPAWVTDVDLVRSDLAKAKRLKEDLSRAHTKHLRVGFDDDTDYSQQEVDRMTKQLQGLVRGSEKVIQRIGAGDGGPPVDPHEATMRRNVMTALATDLHGLTSGFRKDQQKYLQRLRGHEEKSRGYTVDPSAGGGMFDDIDVGFSTSQMAQLEQHEAMSEERETEILKITSSIDELATMFKELAVLVIDQGTIIDRIDYNVEMVEGHTADANRELQKAHDHASSSKLTGCIACLAIAVAVMFVILMNKLFG